MSGRQALIAVIVLILAFFCTIGAWNYFNFSIEAKRIEAEEKSRQINEEDHKALYELLEKLKTEKSIVESFLPVRLTEEKLREIITEFIAFNDEARHTLKDIMTFLKVNYKNLYDGKQLPLS